MCLQGRGPQETQASSKETYADAERAARLSRQVYADSPEQMISVMSTHVICLSEQGKWPEALEVYQEVIEIHKTTLTE